MTHSENLGHQLEMLVALGTLLGHRSKIATGRKFNFRWGGLSRPNGLSHPIFSGVRRFLEIDSLRALKGGFRIPQLVHLQAREVGFNPENPALNVARRARAASGAQRQGAVAYRLLSPAPTCVASPMQSKQLVRSSSLSKPKVVSSVIVG